MCGIVKHMESDRCLEKNCVVATFLNFADGMFWNKDATSRISHTPRMLECIGYDSFACSMYLIFPVLRSQLIAQGVRMLMLLSVTC